MAKKKKEATEQKSFSATTMSSSSSLRHGESRQAGVLDLFASIADNKRALFLETLLETDFPQKLFSVIDLENRAVETGPEVAWDGVRRRTLFHDIAEHGRAHFLTAQVMDALKRERPAATAFLLRDERSCFYEALRRNHVGTFLKLFSIVENSCAAGTARDYEELRCLRKFPVTHALAKEANTELMNEMASLVDGREMFLAIKHFDGRSRWIRAARLEQFVVKVGQIYEQSRGVPWVFDAVREGLTAPDDFGKTLTDYLQERNIESPVIENVVGALLREKETSSI